MQISHIKFIIIKNGDSTMNNISKHEKYWALYVRLSHEDGDKSESLSISNQKLKLINFIKQMPETPSYKLYIDDGFSGTTFNRPGFQNILSDIKNNLITGIIVKDLSRLGRNSPKTSYFIHDFFPSYKIRFIAIDDNIDKDFYDIDTSDDMIIDIKNMFNGFYPRDISSKVRSTFRAKQSAGQFIGAFACYGYKKSPDDHNKLIIDDTAAAVVKKIYTLYLAGTGQNTIAKILNKNNIPCPSEYKKLNGLNYKNGNKLDHTTYWTYSTIRNILKNEMYTGCMVQNKSFRTLCSKNASPLPKDKWIIVPDTHEAIIDKITFNRVQTLITKNIRHTGLNHNVHLLAGIIKCGDCGRAMVKTTKNGKNIFVCGSYNRYGKTKCSAHRIYESTILKIITSDFNNILKEADNLNLFLHKELSFINKNSYNNSLNEHIQYKINKLEQKKKMYFEDYNENLITAKEYFTLVKRCDLQISNLNTSSQISEDTTANIYTKTYTHVINEMLEKNMISEPDRIVITQMINYIYIYKNNTIKIIYNFDNGLV